MKITGKSTDTATKPFFSLLCFSGTMLPLYRQQDRHLGHTIFQNFSQISCNSYLLTIFVKSHSMLPISEKKKKIKITYFCHGTYVKSKCSRMRVQFWMDQYFKVHLTNVYCFLLEGAPDDSGTRPVPFHMYIKPGQTKVTSHYTGVPLYKFPSTF